MYKSVEGLLFGSLAGLVLLEGLLAEFFVIYPF